MGFLFLAGSRKLEYGGQTWHEHCFLCSGCEQPLGSRSFVPDKGAHYCVPCYENKFAPRCARCSKVGAGPVNSGEDPLWVGILIPLLMADAPHRR